MNRDSVCDMSKKYHSRFYQVSSPGKGSGHAKSADSVPSASLTATIQREGLSAGSVYMVQDMRLSTNTFVRYV